MVQRLWNLIRKRSGSNSGEPISWLDSWKPTGERTKLSVPPGGSSLSQVTSPLSNLRSHISGIRKPWVIASTNGGQRLTVFSSRPLSALKACGGMDFSQPGSPDEAGTGAGSTPSSSAGQRNLRVIGFSGIPTWVCTSAVFFLFSETLASPPPLTPEAAGSTLPCVIRQAGSGFVSYDFGVAGEMGGGTPLDRR